MKTLIAAAALALLSTAAHADQTCSGLLVNLTQTDADSYNFENAGYQLLNPDGACNATLYGHTLRKVLKVCALEKNCRIAGSFAGHAGSFSWIEVKAVKRLPTPADTDQIKMRVLDSMVK